MSQSNKMKYIIKLENGYYVEKFFAKTYLITTEINRARKYSKMVAEAQIIKKNLKADITPAQ